MRSPSHSCEVGTKIRRISAVLQPNASVCVFDVQTRSERSANHEVATLPKNPSIAFPLQRVSCVSLFSGNFHSVQFLVSTLPCDNSEA